LGVRGGDVVAMLVTSDSDVVCFIYRADDVLF